jgi:hypothetical protein
LARAQKFNEQRIENETKQLEEIPQMDVPTCVLGDHRIVKARAPFAAQQTKR